MNIHAVIWFLGFAMRARDSTCASVTPQDTSVRIAEQNANNMDKAHFQQR